MICTFVCVCIFFNQCEIIGQQAARLGREASFLFESLRMCADVSSHRNDGGGGFFRIGFV